RDRNLRRRGEQHRIDVRSRELPEAKRDGKRDHADDEVVQLRAPPALGGSALGACTVVGKLALSLRVGKHLRPGLIDRAHATALWARCGRAECSWCQICARNSAKRGSARIVSTSRGRPNGMSSTSLMRPGRAVMTAMRSPSRIASSIEWVMNT